MGLELKRALDWCIDMFDVYIFDISIKNSLKQIH